MTTQLIQKVSGIAAPTGTPSNRIGTRDQNAAGTASKWSAGAMTVDGTHPSDTCHTTVAAAVTAIIQTYAVA